jgi:hypothetical protein
VRPDGHTVVPPAHTPPGLYKLLLSFYDPATLATLPAVTLDGASLGDVLPVAMLQVGDGPPVAGVQWRFGQLLALDGVALAAEPAVGEPLQITLNWESLARTATPYTLFTHLVGPDGAQVAGVDGPPLGGFAATNLLLPGQRFADALSVMLPADAPSGAYRVQMGLYDAATGARLPLTGAGQSGDAAPVLEFVLP